MTVMPPPDHRFQSLPGYPFNRNYCAIRDEDGTENCLQRVGEGLGASIPVAVIGNHG